MLKLPITNVAVNTTAIPCTTGVHTQAALPDCLLAEASFFECSAGCQRSCMKILLTVHMQPVSIALTSAKHLPSNLNADLTQAKLTYEV